MVRIWAWVYSPDGAVSSLAARLGAGGAVSLVVAVVPLLIVAEQGRKWGWDSDRALGCYLVGVVGVAAFVLEKRECGK